MTEPMPRVHHGDRKPWDSDVKDAEKDAKDGDKALWQALKDASEENCELRTRVEKIEKWMWLHQGIFAVVGVIGYMIFQKLFK